MNDDELLAGLLRRMLTLGTMYAYVEGNEFTLDGFVTLTPDEKAILHRLTGRDEG